MAFSLLWACVLIVFFSVSIAEKPNISALYPPKWKESPDNFDKYKLQNGKYVIDPWIYTERLGMYRILLIKTAKYFERFGEDNEQNPLWGLALQFGWQYTSGKNVSYFYSNDQLI